MNESLPEIYHYKRLRQHFLIFLAACVGFYTVIYMPIWFLIANSLWRETAWMLIWGELVKPLMQYTFYLGSIAFSVYAVLRFGWRRASGVFGYYVLAVFLRYTTSIFSYMWVLGALHVAELDISGRLLSMLGDCLQMALVLLLVYVILRRTASTDRRLAKTGALLSACMPLQIGLRLKNPILRIAFFTGAVPGAVMILQRIYYDIYNVLENLKYGYDAINGVGDIIAMLIYYLSDLLMIPLGYLAVALIIARLDRKKTEE